MEKVIKYKCDHCGELFDTEKLCISHERRHQKVDKANEMLRNGAMLQEINDACCIWYQVPEHLKEVTTNHCLSKRC